MTEPTHKQRVEYFNDSLSRFKQQIKDSYRNEKGAKVNPPNDLVALSVTYEIRRLREKCNMKEIEGT